MQHSSPELPIFFAEIPSNHEITKHLKDFDPTIPLPFIILTKSETENKPQLTMEMIIAGLLFVFANDRENRFFDYYENIFLELQPKALEKLTEVAILQTKNYEFTEAEQLFKALEGLYKDNNLVMLNLALFYEQRADFFRQSNLLEDAQSNDILAESYYSDIILADPPIPSAFFNAGFYYVKQKNYAKARSLFNTYIKIETEQTENAKLKKEKAQEIIDNISKQKLDDIAYLDAIQFINTNECEKALDRIRAFLSEHPKSWNGWFILGWALRKLNRWDNAKEAFIKCLDLGQKSNDIETAYSDICNELSICFVELGDMESAKKWLLSALENDVENIKLLSNLGSIEYKKGNYSEATGFFKTILTINPSDEQSIEMLEHIENL